MATLIERMLEDRIMHDYNQLEESSQDFVDSILALAVSAAGFHERFNIPREELSIPPCPGSLSKKDAIAYMRMRLSLLIEEAGEHSKAINSGDQQEALKELVDIVYIAIGSLYSLGKFADIETYNIADKNDRKTTETHYWNSESGKILLRG